MKKLLGLAAVLLAIVGCSNCRDGTNWYQGYTGGYQYTECERGCCQKEDPKGCKCSVRCSCHQDHTCKEIHATKVRED